MTAVPKPIRAPRTTCPRCRKSLTARAMLRHSRCGSGNKYGAKRTVTKHGAFPSRLESDVFDLLKAMEIYGVITSLERYQTVELIPGLKWKCDFTAIVVKTGRREWFEAKGVETERYRIIKTVWAECGPGALNVFKAGRKGPAVVEVIHPRKVP